ncbi:MAG: hypothetical protein EXS36_20420 [Pedosphaera sp.]|nr:hypothetical protein [Pedosphaera sp.]
MPSFSSSRRVCAAEYRIRSGFSDCTWMNFLTNDCQGRSEFRLRVGDYRVIYEFDLGHNELSLATLGHRREVYR